MKELKIWNNNINSINYYVDFYGEFNLLSKEDVLLNISCDNIFEVKVNGEFAGFGNCQNFKNEYKYYTFNISKYCKEKNILEITVWHHGEDTQTYINQPAYLMFNVTQQDNVLLRSNKNIMCRENNQYTNGPVRRMTAQLGFTFICDLTKEKGKFENSIEYGYDTATKNDTLNLNLLGRAQGKIIELDDSYIIDLGKETVGYLELDIDAKSEEKLLISYGERLDNGRVPRIIDARDFSVEVKLNKGNNKYLNVFRRLAGRYLEVNKGEYTINYLGLKVVEYPLEVIERKFNDSLLQKIYDTSIYTLRCCIHEHYEDCPWREQALYNMDSRNQMLCGYYAFKGTSFQRANLVMMSKGLLTSGLLNICFPSGRELPIPSFNLEYLIQVSEYIDYSKDISILDEIGYSIKSVINAFNKAIDENGLIPNFNYPCWNFYEWSEGCSNDEEISRHNSDDYVKSYDLIINCLYVYVMKFYDKMFNTKTDVENVKKAIKKYFYVEKDGLYKLSTKNDKYSVLGNSLAILIGLGGKDIAEKLVKGDNLIPITLSMNTFFYDALLGIDKNYKDYIMNSIKTKYKKMLDEGATTFWETELGYKDFNNAGSLCHGWSAMPIYYFNIFDIK